MSFSDQKKLVSVIIPSYNSARFLKYSISSALTQSYENIEVIVVNDGSNDETDSVVKEFMSDKRFFYYKKENEGVSRTRNAGAARSKGDYLCFLDADDVFFANNIQKKVLVLNANKDIGAVHSDVQYLNENGEGLNAFNSGIAGKDKHLDVLLWNECVVPAFSSNIMMRKEIYQEAGQFDPQLSTAADQDLLIRICKITSLFRIPEVLVGYRTVKGSMGRQSSVFEKDHTSVYQKAKERGDFTDNKFMRTCFAKLHLIIASTWWVQNKNLLKTIKHLFLSLRYSPKPFLKKLGSIF